MGYRSMRRDVDGPVTNVALPMLLIYLAALLTTCCASPPPLVYDVNATRRYLSIAHRNTAFRTV
jgi:hypothetical protein